MKVCVGDDKYRQKSVRFAELIFTSVKLFCMFQEILFFISRMALISTSTNNNNNQQLKTNKNLNLSAELLYSIRLHR